MRTINTKQIEEATRLLLEAVGDNPEREGLKETPARVARYYEEALKGMTMTNEDIAFLHGKTFRHVGDLNDMVLVKDIDTFSYCEHHLALIYDMKVSVAYYPNGKVIGLSKIARIVDLVCSRLQIQERIGRDIKDILRIILDTSDIAVIVTASHSCMASRGIKKPGAKTTTKTLGGRFNDPEELQNLLTLI